MPPIWSAMEAVSFGTLSHLYSNLNPPLQKAIAKRFNYPENVVLSWFRSTTLLRNASAHHARLWNTRNGVDKPMRARKVKDEFGESMNTFFARAVAIVALFEELGHDRGWKMRLRELIDTHPFVDESQMGFPEGWRDRSFWK
jgi:abortive infection bacteriophage resistance protein